MFGKIKSLPIIVILVFLVCFVSLIAYSRQTGHVNGIVRVYNLENGEWEWPNNGEQIQVRLFDGGAPWGYPVFTTVINGKYDSYFPGASSCDRVDVFFRNQTFTDDFNYSTGTVVDVYFDPYS